MEKKTKIILIIIIIITSIMILGTVEAIVDYYRATNGKEPIFSKNRVIFQSFDVSVAGEEENTENSSSTASVYFGLGYKIVTCDFCERSVYFMPFGIGTYPYANLTCTQEFAKDDKHTIQYTFLDGKVDTISTTLIIPAKDIADEESYEREFNKINDITGCGGEFKKNINLYGDVSYTTSQSCELGKMSDDDVQVVYTTDRDSLEQTRKEIIKGYKDNPAMKCSSK